ncbi:MAG TPA: FHA domain-containing protein, partial [Gemmataceae bacterium]|nr:FHA domain-containing protein [Gemmataceae bacterium]
MKVSLVVMTAGKGQGKTIPIPLSPFLIGRDPQCHLRPASPIISKRHCAVIFEGDQVRVRDFGSTNGTFVNNKQIEGEVVVTNEDKLQVGPLVFRVLIEGAVPTPVNKPTPMPPTKVPAGPPESDD